MQLKDYVAALRAGQVPAPATIEIPAALMEPLLDLYHEAEHHGREHGAQLVNVPGADAFILGPIGVGEATHMDIPKSHNPDAFGDIHAHPSASIGHVDGYSAHSMSDLKHFADTQQLPFFMQFVVSGPFLHAMVQVQHVSTWDNDVVEAFCNERSNIERAAMFDAITDLVGGDQAWLDLLEHSGANDDEVIGERLLTEYKGKAGVGQLAQDLSIKHCFEFARQFNFFFYSGTGGTLTRVA